LADGRFSCAQKDGAGLIPHLVSAIRYGVTGTYEMPLVTYTKPLPPEVPPAVVTVTSTVPGVLVAGMVAVTSVDDTTVTLVAAVVPKVTAVAPDSSVPVMATEVPPVMGPESGETDVIVGAGGGEGDDI